MLVSKSYLFIGAEYPFIRELRERGVLQSVISNDSNVLDFSNGVIAYHCSDCDKRPDLPSFLDGLCVKHRKTPRVHSFSLNGGPLVIPRVSPLNKDGKRGDAFIEDAQIALSMKGANMPIVLYAHYPCGAAKFANLCLRDVMSMLFEAQIRVNEEVRPQKTHCLLHVDYGTMLGISEHATTLEKMRYHAWTAAFNQMKRLVPWYACMRTYYASSKQWDAYISSH